MNKLLIKNMLHNTVVKNFDCLHGKSVLAAIASDHDPVVASIGPLRVCAFNILCECASFNNGSRYNNHFKINEEQTPGLYERRLTEKIIPVIQELIAKYQINIFLLQEAPRTPHVFYHQLQRALPNFYVNDTHMLTATQGLRSAMFCAAEHTLFPVQHLEDTNTIGVPGRSQALHLQTTSQQIVKILHIHGEVSSDQHAQQRTADSIERALAAGYIIGGDFNIEAQSYQQPQFDFGIIQKAEAFRTVDGIIARKQAVESLL